LRAQAPRYAKLIPELPRLVHDYLKQGNHQQTQQLMSLLQEQRRTNQLLQRVIWSGFGFLAGLLAMQLLTHVFPFI
jgi:ubiquinone biosynthesis protein